MLHALSRAPREVLSAHPTVSRRHVEFHVAGGHEPLGCATAPRALRVKDVRLELGEGQDELRAKREGERLVTPQKLSAY